MTKRILSLLLCSAIMLTTFFALPQPAVAAEADSSVSEAAIPEESTPPADETVSTPEPEPDVEAPAPEADASLLPEETPAAPEDSSVPEAPPEPDEAPGDISAPVEEPVPPPEALPTEEAPAPISETEPLAPDTEAEAEVEDTDKTAPVVTNVRILNPSVFRPGVLNIEVDFIEEDTGVTGVTVGLMFLSKETEIGKHLSGSYYGRAKYTGTVSISIPVPVNTAVGQWVINSINISDQVGNSKPYSSYSHDFGGLTGYYLDLHQKTIYAPQAEIKDEFDIDFEVALSNPNLASRIEAMEEGRTAKILIDAPTDMLYPEEVDLSAILPAAAFDAIRGKDKTLVLYNAVMVMNAGAYQWIINGRDVDKPSKDVWPSILIKHRTGADFGTEQDVVSVLFAPNGELPGKVRIRIKSDYLYNQMQLKGTLYLYYMGSEGLEAEQTANFDLAFDGTDKWCYFDVTHNSEYIISATPLSSEINPIAITSLSFTKPIQALAVKKSLKAPKLTALPAGALNGKTITWKSDNRSVATVNSKTGKVTAKGKPGRATIIAYAGGRQASYTIYVYSPKSKYTVKLKASNKKYGTVSGGRTTNGGKTITLRAKPKKGYEFVGWYDDSTRLSTKAKYKYKVCKDVTLRAKFKKI